MKQIQFSELGNYSELPRKIIFANEANKRIKSRKEVLREFNDEKWMQVTKFITADHKRGIKEVDEYFLEFKKQIPFVKEKQFILGSGKECFDEHLLLFELILKPYLRGASCLIELGAGYGSKIINIGINLALNNLPLYALEFTERGREATEIIGARHQLNIKVGECDFNKLTMDNMGIPKGGVVFTSYAMHYMPKLSDLFVDYLMQLRPKVVINFEPCYEHKSNSIYAMMCKKYIEINDYNTDMGIVLDAQFRKRNIKNKIKMNVFGSNPFLPISIFEWHPNS